MAFLEKSANEAGAEVAEEGIAVELCSYKNKAAGGFAACRSFLEGETAADQVKGELGGIFRQAQEALGAEYALGKGFEKSLEAVGIDRALAGEGNAGKFMVMRMIAVWPAFVAVSLVGGVDVRAADTEDKFERNLA